MIDVRGKVVDVVVTLTGKARMTIEMDGTPELDSYTGSDAPELRIRLSLARKARSLDANAYFWSMVAMIQSVTGQDKMDIYLMLLKRYGTYTYLVVREDAIERLRSVWREIEILGDTTTATGAQGKSVLAYYGSSTYDSAEMARLIDGTVDEVRALGLTPPPTRDMAEAIERMVAAEKK